jgi:Flp pilus assembly protein TadD
LKQQLDSAKATEKDFVQKINKLESQIAGNDEALQKLRVSNKQLNRRAASLTQQIKNLRVKLAKSPTATKTQHVFLTKPDTISSKRMTELMQGGLEAEKKGSDDVAIWHYTRILESVPKNITANHRLGAIYLKREQFKEAANVLQKAYILKPGSADIAADYAKALLTQKKYGNAIAVLQKALKKHPEDSRLLYESGIALQTTGNISGAEKALNKSIKLNPDSAPAYLELALLITKNDKKRLDEAAACYRKARKLGAAPDPLLEKALSKKLADNSEMIEFLTKAAVEAERSKDWTSAAWYYAQLSKLTPGKSLYSNKLTMAYLMQDKPDKALQAVSPSNKNIDGLLLAGIAYALSDNSTQADKYLKQALNFKRKAPAYLDPVYSKTEKYLLKSGTKDKSGKAKSNLQLLKKAFRK